MTLAQRSGVPLDWHGLAVCMAPRLPSLPSAIDQLVLTKHYSATPHSGMESSLEAWNTDHRTRPCVHTKFENSIN
eukprot:scaffold53501_cov69-Phaeocystis_antarctica.AAC.4